MLNSLSKICNNTSSSVIWKRDGITARLRSDGVYEKIGTNQKSLRIFQIWHMLLRNNTVLVI